MKIAELLKEHGRAKRTRILLQPSLDTIPPSAGESRRGVPPAGLSAHEVAAMASGPVSPVLACSILWCSFRSCQRVASRAAPTRLSLGGLYALALGAGGPQGPWQIPQLHLVTKARSNFFHVTPAQPHHCKTRIVLTDRPIMSILEDVYFFVNSHSNP